MKRSLAQIEASRRNGARSRGPVTPEGKARASQNAVKHGLHTHVAVLNNESPDDYRLLLDELLAEYQPVTRDERDLVHDMANSKWRLSRILVLETAGIDHEVDRQRAAVSKKAKNVDEPTRTHLAISALTAESRTLAWYSRHEGRLRRAIRDARAQLEKCKKEPGVACPLSPRMEASTATAEPSSSAPTPPTPPPSL